ncbi:MAG: hypothetical protein NC341_04040 [Blautia sp.]|nr:hypothetical protein [Blautia sp.]MCM1200768.1 hypothetical protein [Bacteroides fragilis]
MDDKKEKQLLRYQYFFQIFDEWMSLKENNRDIDDILYTAGYRRIAVYGMGRMCMHLYNVLMGSKVEIVYMVDKQSFELYGGIYIHNIEYDFEAVDAVIYTDMEMDSSILARLKEKLSDKIISLADVVFDNMPQ